MESPIPPDPYKTLGIDKNAPLATVRSAHRKLVLTCHPDKVTDESAKKAASDKFHLVQQAYEILSDETRRERYDERVKLADLRAQMMKEKEKGGSRVIPDIGIRGGPKRTHEMRDNTIYEYREPREPPPRSRAYEEEDYFQPRYQEVRPSKKFDDRSFAPTPRKTSGRAAEDKRRAREFEDERERKRESFKAEEKARAERSRRRGMDRKKDYEYKNQSSRKFATVQDDSDSTDSDSTETFIHPRREDTSKKRYEDERRREKDDTPRRNTKRDPYDYDDKHSRAQDYITQSRGSVEPEPRRLAPHNRSFSYVERPPPPPAAPIVPVGDTSARRSSARDSRRRESSPPRLSKKDRRVTEIVDPPSTRKTSLPGSSSDPKGLKLPQSPIPRRDRDREPHRSATLEHTPEPKQPGIRRAETMPSNSRRADNAPAKSSKLKEQHDSGYSSRSSRGTPELSPAPSPQMTSTKYRYNDDSEDEVTIVAEPEETYRRHRDDSPPTSRRERPKMSSRESKMPGRDPTSTRAAPPRQPPFVRTESSRPPLKSRASTRGAAPLYGEVVTEILDPYEVVNHSPKYRQDDIRYTDYPRRGSADDRDLPYRHRQEFSRSESRAVHA